MNDQLTNGQPQIKMLIIDDEMSAAKGYGSIEDEFPGVFRIDESRRWNCDSVAVAERAMVRLLQQRYDIILLDYLFPTEKKDGKNETVSGLTIIREIRKGINGASHENRALNRDAYVLGVSNRWGDDYLEPIAAMLDAHTDEGTTNQAGLFEKLRHFLELRRKGMTRASEAGEVVDSRITTRPVPPRVGERKGIKR